MKRSSSQPDFHRRHLSVALLLFAAARPSRAAAPSRILRVGPTAPIRRIAEAARLARDGDIVEIEPGDYVADVAVWKQKRLTIRSTAAAGGRRGASGTAVTTATAATTASNSTATATNPSIEPVRLIANGKAAEAKAIWVVRNGVFDIEGIEFHGTRVPDKNGAGIRFEHGQLTVRDCRFLDNETGILTGNDGVAELTLESCEFEGRAQPADGFSHNLYVGAIARFEMRACWSHHANAGHLVKTRARESRLLYNRLTDEPGGRASYEIDCPNGGVLIAVGNLIVQEPTTQNNALVSYGAEGYRWPLNRLVLAHNTLVNRREIGTFVRVYPGNVESRLVNNLFVGSGINDGTGPLHAGGNRHAAPGQFRDPARFDFHLRADSALRGRAVAPRDAGVGDATPSAEYEHPRRLRLLRDPIALSPGAFQS